MQMNDSPVVTPVTESPATPATSVTYRKKGSKRINYALAGVLSAQGLGWDEIAPKVGAKNGESVRIGMLRKGVTQRQAQAVTTVTETSKARSDAVVARTVTEATEIIRESLNEELIRQVKLLADSPARSLEELASKGQGRSAVAKTIAETFRATNGSGDSINIVFGVSSLSGDGAQPQPVVVDAEVVPDKETTS